MKIYSLRINFAVKAINKVKEFFVYCALTIFSYVFKRPAGQTKLIQHLPYWHEVMAKSFAESITHFENPYNLSTKRLSARRDIRERDDVIFITGRFRSGSTLLWNIFRDIPGFFSYYEPFNERRWFNSELRGQSTDKTHLGVQEYWREYNGLEKLEKYFNEGWNDQRLFMTEQSWDDNMISYIDILIQHAQGRPVLQFNRVDFRLAWLRRQYPKARIVHIYRNPRDQWLSIIKEAERCPSEINFSALGTQDFFYLRRWGRDLCTIFPFLEESRLNHPFELFYLIWRLSYNHGKSFADHSIAFEQLINEPNNCLEDLFAALNTNASNIEHVTDKIEAIQPDKWKNYATDEWFTQYENKCEFLLESYYTGKVKK